MQCIGAELGHATKVQGIVQFGGRENEIAWQVLLVVLNHEWNGARIDALLSEIRVQILKAGHVVAHGTTSAHTVICDGSRNYSVRITRTSGSGAFTLTVSKP